VPVLFRVQSNAAVDSWVEDKYQIISHPVLLQLPNQLTCAQLYESVESFVPFPVPFTLRFVSSTVSQECTTWDSFCHSD
jgi:hypothetical protein